MVLEDFNDDDDGMPEEIAKLVKAFGSDEPLHPDLVPHVRTDTVLPMVHHPLVVSVAMPNSHKFMNQQYLQKKAAIEQLAAEGEWRQYILMHERPYRYDALLYAINHGLAKNPDKFWSCVAYVWTDSENIRQNQAGWMKIWASGIPHREKVMTDKERAALAKLPNEIVVYRGVGHKQSKLGLSWTTDKARAEWFAKRFAGVNGRSAHVFQGVVQKSDVLAHFLGRNEDEIVALPRSVKDIRQL
jgi:hypothetical protein